MTVSIIHDNINDPSPTDSACSTNIVSEMPVQSASPHISTSSVVSVGILPDGLKISQQISEFLQLMEQAQRSYTYSAEEVQRMELLTQDYLHKLELQSCSYHARTRVATAIQQGTEFGSSDRRI